MLASIGAICFEETRKRKERLSQGKKSFEKDARQLQLPVDRRRPKSSLCADPVAAGWQVSGTRDTSANLHVSHAYLMRVSCVCMCICVCMRACVSAAQICSRYIAQLMMALSCINGINDDNDEEEKEKLLCVANDRDRRVSFCGKSVHLLLLLLGAPRAARCLEEGKIESHEVSPRARRLRLCPLRLWALWPPGRE